VHECDFNLPRKTVSSNNFSFLSPKALDKFIVPWTIVTLNAVIWTIVAETDLPSTDADSYFVFKDFFGLVINTTLAFLLVFRLNRSAERYWRAREAWGTIVAMGK
jgi:predicted membrane chloride channel (bestrophin family)